jgi:hypothetical protein
MEYIVAKKKAAPKTATPKVSPKKTAKKKAVPAVQQVGGGRPKGASNFVPAEGLEVRDLGKFKGTFDGTIGPRWARIYAADQEHSLLLSALVSAVKAKDPELLKYLRRKTK